VDEDETRILYIEKWPLKYNYCIRYMMDKSGNMQKISGLFDLQEQMKRKILSLEFKSMLTEALEITEKEGIEVEGEEVAEKARRKRKNREALRGKRDKEKHERPRSPKTPSPSNIAKGARVKLINKNDSGPS